MDSTNNFYVQAYYQGGMTSFEVVQMEGKFGIFHDGEMLAEVEVIEDWDQITGEPLGKDVFDSITQQIDKHQSGESFE